MSDTIRLPKTEHLLKIFAHHKPIKFAIENFGRQAVSIVKYRLRVGIGFLN